MFVRAGRLFELVVAGRTLRTTPEHPFFVREQGWTPAGELKPGDLLSTPHSEWLPVERLTDTGRQQTVYNFRVAEYATYFIAPADLAFDVWVHNTYGAKGVVKSIDGYDVGRFYDVGSHHIIQGAAVRELPGYKHGVATAVDLGSILDPNSSHRLTRAAQRMSGGGTYAAERRIAYRALRDAGVPQETAKKLVREADTYFSSIGVTMTTRTRIPGDR